MANEVNLDSSGNRILVPNGQEIIAGTSTLCCTYCDCNCTPATISVVVSGITLCSGCFPFPGGGYQSWDDGDVGPDGTYCLTQSDNCVWQYGILNADTISQYTDPLCTLSGFSRSADLSITLTRSSGLWAITINNGVTTSVDYIQVFSATYSVSGCLTDFSVDNSFTSCQSPVTSVLGYDGAVSVVFNGC